MLGLDSKEIEEIILKLDRRIASEKKKMLDLGKEKAVIVADEKIISSALSVNETYAKILRNALLVSRGVPKDIAALRKTIIDRIRESQRKNILISRKEELEKEFPELKKKLQKLCNHPFIVGRVSYSSYDGYETSWVVGYRKCVICEFGEKASDSVVHSDGPWSEIVDKFTTLNESNDRVVDKNGLGDKDVSDIWQPLEEVLKHFIDKRVYEIIKA